MNGLVGARDIYALVLDRARWILGQRSEECLQDQCGSQKELRGVCSTSQEEQLFILRYHFKLTKSSTQIISSSSLGERVPHPGTRPSC